MDILRCVERVPTGPGNVRTTIPEPSRHPHHSDNRSSTMQSQIPAALNDDEAEEAKRALQMSLDRRGL